ncbi:MAG TPA: YtxH domain-containing protein [Pseudogracilibacillus sp.]|nr:YtxH domain-containing protein [Pseudogracilibacillus sp.]
MGKRIFWTSIALGAVIGGLTSLRKREVRQYVKDSVETIGDATTYYAANPTEAIENVKATISVIEQKLDDNSASAVNALNQIETTVNKISKKK